MMDYLYSGFFVLLVAAFAFWQLDLSRKREREVYNRIIESQQSDIKDLRDRFFMSKGQPPSGVDVKEERAKRIQKQEERAERVEGLPVPHNAVDRARADAIAAEDKALRKGAQP